MGNLVIKTASASFVGGIGGVLGYSCALFLPTVTPIAGFISGASFGFIACITSEFSNVKETETSDRKKMEAIAVAVTLLASSTLAYLMCRCLHIPLRFTACLLFHWQMCLSFTLALVPFLIISEIAKLVLG